MVHISAHLQFKISSSTSGKEPVVCYVRNSLFRSEEMLDKTTVNRRISEGSNAVAQVRLLTLLEELKGMRKVVHPSNKQELTLSEIH